MTGEGGVEMKTEDVRKYVRDRYAGIAKQGGSCCGPSACCGAPEAAEEASGRIGYTEEEMKSAPRGSNLGLGCGNPTALASLRAGETVLDLGSGAGFDCFLAAEQVGNGGIVIGVDMTPEMIQKARENARKGNHENVEFRLGEIEHLPAANDSVDIVISNCVINLSPAKDKVFAEAYRVLKPGGRAMISDIVLSGDLPEAVAGSLAAYAGCIAGAIREEEYLRLMEAAGFRDVHVVQESRFAIAETEIDEYARSIAGNFNVPPEAVREAARSVLSVQVFGRKPA
ncbi:MAG TPA: arsenite methyltransferase [Patescibacteria group bacterium]|nr:arsenite methyltransferase [Patescibacteria group bacterium]